MLKVGDKVEVFQEDNGTPIVPVIIGIITEVEDVQHPNGDYQCFWIGDKYGFFFDYQARKVLE